MPMSYNVFAFFNLIQLSSVKVVPADIPNICVCTAPATPIVHKSLLLFAPSCGEIAEGGGDFTVVVISPFEVIVLLVVESVSITSAYATLDTNNAENNTNHLYIVSPKIIYILSKY